MTKREFLVGALCGFGGATLGWLDHRRTARPPRARGGPSAHLFPDIELLTHEGRTVRLYDDLIQGNRVVAINFMYATCEGVCAPVTRNLVKVQQILGSRLGRDVFLYSVTLKPELDTPEVLADYARENETGPGWTFLTGRPRDLDGLRRDLGFFDRDPAVDADRTQHFGMLCYGNDARHAWAACPGLAAPEQIVTMLGWMEDPARRGAAPRAMGPG
jgi:protein SCO1/2